MLSIIVLNYNRIQYTKQTVQNLIDQTAVEHEFIFVDNGSVDGTREYLKSLQGKTNAKQIKYVFNERNFGVAGGRNSGMRVAEGDYLMTIDDDILVPYNYDRLLIEACDKIPDLGITGVCVEPEKKKYTYPITDVNGVKMRKKKGGNLGGGCLCMPRRVFKKVGYFAPDFVYGGEDCDMYIRLCMLNLRSLYVVPFGKHIDKRDNAKYERIKRKAHSKSSSQFAKVGENEITYKKTGVVHRGYKEPNINSDPFDDIIKGVTSDDIDSGA